MKSASRFLFSISAVLGVFLSGLPAALAQESNLALEEIVVTAEKRATPLQDTAISITAYTGDQMRRLGVRDALDLAKMVPNLNIGARRNEILVNIRGIQSNNTTEVGDPAVALHLDGIYLSRPRGAAALFYDVERIEVLRGPQGTLYGRNATAGNINIITNKPINEFDASGEVTVGNYDRISTRGMINVPVIDDKWMVRASFMTDKRDGFNENDRLFDIDATDDADDVAFRLHSLFNINEDMTLLLSGRYHDIGGVGGNPGFQKLIENPNDLRVITLNTQPYIDAEVYGITAQFDWSFENMALTYVGGWNVDDVKDRLQDADQVTPVFSANATALFGPFSQWTEVFTHELRLASTGDGPFNWIFGLYHFDEDQTVFLNFQPNPATTVLEFDQYDIGAKSKAAFGEIKFDVTDQIELVGGARYTDDDKHRNGETRTVVNGSVVARSPNIGASSSSNVDWKGGVNFRPADSDALYFFSVSTGYKAGGFNDGVGAPYDPEEVLSYELGTKQMFFDQRLMLNGSVFYMDYSDLQVSATGVGPTGLPGLFTQNAAEATVQGGEIEMVAILSEFARIDGSIGYVDATYDEYETDDPSVPGTLIEDLSGNRLTKAPEWTLNLGFEYEMQLGSIGTLTPRVQFHYEDDQFLREFNKPVDHEGSFTRTDVVVAYRHSEGHWYVEGFVNNIEDDDIRNNLQNFPGHGLQYQLDAARTYGLRVGFEL